MKFLKLNKKIKIIKKKNLSKKDKKEILIILKKENADSIISKLPKKIILDYLNIIINSKYLHLFVATYKLKIVGYLIIAEKPVYLISEFYSLKYKFFFYLLINFKFITILNIIISILKIDMIFIKKNQIKLIESNYNLNLLAVKKSFQSIGVGRFFLKKVIEIIKIKKKKFIITCETFSNKALKFYLKKCKFKKIGTKVRFFKNLHVLAFRIK